VIEMKEGGLAAYFPSNPKPSLDEAVAALLAELPHAVLEEAGSDGTFLQKASELHRLQKVRTSYLWPRPPSHLPARPPALLAGGPAAAARWGMCTSCPWSVRMRCCHST